MIDIKLIKKPKGTSSGTGTGSGGGTHVGGFTEESRHALKADKSLKSDRSDYAERSAYADRAGESSRAAYSDVAEDLAEGSPVFGKFLSRIANDTAHGIITFVKGLFVGDGSHGIDENGDATLKSINVNNHAEITEDGDASLNSLESANYSGTDIISDKGFKMWEDSEGKSHVIVDYFTARVKAFFASLEVRKIEHTAGNRIESPAGNTLALVRKFNADDEEIKDKWHARRYGFGLSWGYKLVHVAGQFFGVWKEDETAEAAYYRCYWTADDKEAKKAVTNNWKVGDQAFCETFNLRTKDKNGHTMRGYASNKRYWRLVVGTGYETIEGTDYAYIDLSNVANNVTVVDEEGNERLCNYGYEPGTEDRPEAGDDVACFGNQLTPSTRGSAIQYITYDPNSVNSGDGVPCVKMYSGINSFTSLDNFVIQKLSPTGVYVRADKFTIYSASGTGMGDNPSSTLICDRGAYSNTAHYAYGDLVQYKGSTWVCIATNPIAGIAPAENSTAWKIYARRGMATPYIQLDCSNVIVDANSEGRISSQSNIIVKPTKIELYVEGNKIPVSTWDMLNSYVTYYNRTQYFTQAGLQPGINIGSFTASDDYVTINWQYYPIVNGQTITNPVIDSTSLAFHIVFTYDGETYVAETSIPLTVQRPGANGTNGTNGTNGHDVMAEYSVNGSSWHPTFQNGDIYVRYSYDGGTTWTQAIRFVGKSIEFDGGIRHFDSYDDLMDYLTSIQTHMTAKDMGYYLTDTDDGGTPEASLWYFLSQSSDPRDIQYVPLPQSGEVNYLTSYDGHLWHADNASEFWKDLGVIQGADGADGISITLDPATVIFEQDEDDISKFIGVNKAPYFYSTVRVWQGATPLSGTFISSQDISATNCTAQLHPSIANAIVITEIGTYTDNDGNTHYYQSGKVEVTVHVGNQSTTLTLNWVANLLGTWKLSVKDDTMLALSAKTVAVTNEDGTVSQVQWETAISQNSQNISLTAKKDDLAAAGIHLNGENSTIDLRANKTIFSRPDGTPFVKVGADENGIGFLIFMMPDGVTPAYNLGWTGLPEIINTSQEASFSDGMYMGKLPDTYSFYQTNGISAETLYLISASVSLMAYYRYNQTRIKQQDTWVIVPASPNHDGKYYDGNILDLNNQSLPSSTLHELDSISPATTAGDISLWVARYSSISGYDDSSKAGTMQDPIRYPMISLTLTLNLFYVQNSRIIKSEQVFVTKVQDGKNTPAYYFVTDSDGMTHNVYYLPEDAQAEI